MLVTKFLPVPQSGPTFMEPILARHLTQAVDAIHVQSLTSIKGFDAKAKQLR